jgi:hypothetical protein
MIKKIQFYFFFTVLFCLSQNSRAELRVHYSFDNAAPGAQPVTDIVGGYEASLHNGASIVAYTDFDGFGNVLSLGSNNGYLDFGALLGQEVIAGLQDFTISCYVLIDRETNLSTTGNFVWNFGNTNNMESAKNGCMFFSAKNTRYAISKTDWSGEQGLDLAGALSKTVWKHIAVTQSGNTARIYLDGKLVKTATVSIYPKDLGNVTCNYIGRSAYSGDNYLKQACIDEFRIYDEALSAEAIEILAAPIAGFASTFVTQGNPLFAHKYTADAAAMVYNDTLWIFTGEDFAGGQSGYVMKNWCIFSTVDMKNYREYPVPLSGSDFSWSSKQAYAAHIVERNGKFYCYVSTNTTGIGVAVADRPEGPYKDALGKALLTNSNCPGTTHSWACIDPAVFIDDDSQPYIFWGNGGCFYAKLKENMIEIDGAVKRIEFENLYPSYTEAPWVHKYNGKYYLSYATGFPEKISYAMSDNIDGPWEYKGILNEIAGNSNTNHQSIVEYKGKWYFVYHNGAMQTEGTSYSRSVCIDYLYYNEDGTIKRIQMTSEGVASLQGKPGTSIPAVQSTSSRNGQLKLYPNPAKGTIHFRIPGENKNDAEMCLYSYNGTLLKKEIKKNGEWELNTGKLPHGIYFLKVFSEGITYSGEFIKE